MNEYPSGECRCCDTLTERIRALEAHNAVLHEVLQSAVDGMGGSYAIWSVAAKKALAMPQDNSALDAMITRGAEVMRERCMKSCTETYRPFYWDKHAGHEEWPVNNSPEDCSKTISTLPGVTLEDLK